MYVCMYVYVLARVRVHRVADDEGEGLRAPVAERGTFFGSMPYNSVGRLVSACGHNRDFCTKFRYGVATVWTPSVCNYFYTANLKE